MGHGLFYTPKALHLEGVISNLDRKIPKGQLAPSSRIVNPPACYRAAKPQKCIVSQKKAFCTPRRKGPKSNQNVQKSISMPKHGHVCGRFDQLWGHPPGGPKWHLQALKRTFGVSGCRGSVAGRGPGLASSKPTRICTARLSRVKQRPSPARGYKCGCVCSYMAGHYPGILMTGRIGTNTPKFVPPRWGRPPFDPTQTGLCKFGRGFGAR